MRFFRRFSVFAVGTILSLLLVSSSEIAHAETPNGSPGDKCTDVRIFVMRGSGEDGAFGPLLQTVINGSGIYVGDSRVSLRGLTTSDGYPAHLLPPGYFPSKDSGFSHLYQEVSAWKAKGKCPNSKIILMGYSQGAHIVGDLAQIIATGSMPGVPKGDLVGVIMFGDPRFNPNDKAVDAGDYNREFGLLGWRPRFDSSLDGNLISICTQLDGVCQAVKSFIPGVDLAGWLLTHTHYDTWSINGKQYWKIAANFLMNKVDGVPRSYSVVKAVSNPPPTPTTPTTPATPPSITVSNNSGQVTIQLNNFPLGASYFYCHTGDPSVFPTCGSIPNRGPVAVTSSRQSWSSGWCSGSGNFWVGMNAADGHDYYSNQVSLASVGNSLSPIPPIWGETTGSVAHTWTNYSNAGGNQGPTIGSNQTVAISCKVDGFRVADGNTNWYRIAQSPWSDQYFVSADAFYNNGATSGSLHGTPYFDPNVPICGASPTPPVVTPPVVTPPVVTPPVVIPPTWGETTGSVAHTWTNYSNAGGNQGPTIGSNQTVAISCKVDGFRVADGNTAWYRIAQSPWSNQYFVSADAFYNNGATSGSLHGTPYFDPAIANC